MKRLKVILLILISFFFIPNVDAYTLLSRNESNNYGVKKNIKVTNKNKSAILSTPYVSDSTNYVYDFADLLTDEEETAVKQYAEAFKRKTNFEVVFYTINDYSAYQLENEGEIAQNFYDYNDFGLDTDAQYSGIMIVMNKLDTGYVYKDGYFQLLSFGNAQFYYDSDRLTRIQQQLEEYFWSGYYKDTCIKFLDLSEDWYDRGSWNTDGSYYLDSNGMLRQKFRFPFLPIFCISLLVSVIVCSIFIGINKMVKKAQNASQYIDNNDCIFTRKDDVFKTSRTSSYTVSSSSSGSGGSRSRSSSRGSSGRGSSRSSGSRR